MKYSNETLQFWTSPLSPTEEQRVENTVSMIKDALRSYENLSKHIYEVFAQGSYANNTNVRQNSDVDICIMLKSTFFGKYVEGKTNADYGFSSGTITYDDYKANVVNALKTKFGATAVTVGNMCIGITANNYHVNADVVPALQYRNYKIMGSVDPTRYVEGIIYYSKNGTEIVNYPKDHIKNGKQKNNDTNYAYKKLVRIMKHIRDNMFNEGLIDGDIITSFLIECLVWNVPNSRINASASWSDNVRDAIAYLWTAIRDEEHKQWGEVSERLYLFHKGRKWTDLETKDLLCEMYDYLGIV